MSAKNTEPAVPDESYPNVLDLWFAWLKWNKRLMTHNQMPLSGDVTQWIDAWGQAVGQIGLLNVNMANSRSPATEREISTKYSYGRQLGRILDVLTPVVAENGERFCEQGMLKKEDLNEFWVMVKDIYRAKRRRQPSIATVLEAVADLRKNFPDKYQPNFDDIVRELNVLKIHEQP